MIRISRDEESKLTTWYFQIDRKLLLGIILLVCVGAITMISAGAAQASHMHPAQPWYFFINKAIGPYCIGLLCLFGFSMTNKKYVLLASIIALLFGFMGLGVTLIHPMIIKGSARWANIAGIQFMPSDVIKPAFVMLSAWFLAKMHDRFGQNIFINKDAWNIKSIFSWWPYILLFLMIVGIIFHHPDVGSALLYFGILFVMLFVAGMPVKWLPGVGVFAVLFASIALLTMPHIQNRAKGIFSIEPRTQVWYSVNSIKHGNLLGSGDEAFVKDYLPESTNDFVFSSIAEDWGAIGACALIALLIFIIKTLMVNATKAKDPFVVYAIAGTMALFAGQICFNLMTALHIIINKGMTLPFISYGGVSFISFCVLFGMLLAVIREDKWK